jgi:hypothetical protein
MIAGERGADARILIRRNLISALADVFVSRNLFCQRQLPFVRPGSAWASGTGLL